MEQKTSIISHEKIAQLVNNPTNYQYSFALFRLPNQSEQHLMIDLDKPKQVTNEISNLDTGFLINTFNDSHPVKPLYLKADICLTNFTEARVSPKLPSEKLDSFLASLTKPVKTENSLNQSSIFEQNITNSYQEIVQNAIQEIKSGAFEKVVLSRSKQIALPNDFSAVHLFETICKTYPSAFCSMVYTPENGLWIGATPELLASENEQEFQTISLAGTKPLLQDQTIDEVAWTQKEIEEQAMVSRYIVNCFKKIRLRAYKEIGPHTYQAGKLAHLKSTFTVQKENMPFEGLIDQMLHLLHPTSAVCGMPIAPALEFIHENEGYQRSLYSGFWGAINFEGATQLFVNLRCMSIQNKVATLYAGAGITEGSNPEKEYTETELKMNTLLDLLETKK